jgi:hypothetical protein
MHPVRHAAINDRACAAGCNQGMIWKGGYRLSEKIMLKQKAGAG